MTTQKDLFETAPYQAHSDTSKAAADEIADKLPALRGNVYRVIHMAGKEGVTDLDIEGELGIAGSTVRPRRIELLEMGLVVAAKEKKRTPSGRWAYAWISAANARKRA